MFEKGLVEKIDDYGFKNRIRSRSEAIRRLVAESLENQSKEKAEAAVLIKHRFGFSEHLKGIKCRRTIKQMVAGAQAVAATIFLTQQRIT